MASSLFYSLLIIAEKKAIIQKIFITHQFLGVDHLGLFLNQEYHPTSCCGVLFGVYGACKAKS